MGRAKTRKLRNKAHRYLQSLTVVQREALKGTPVRTLVSMAAIEKSVKDLKSLGYIIGIDWGAPGGDRNGNMVGPYSVKDVEVSTRHHSMGCVVDPVTCSICGATFRTVGSASEHFSRGACATASAEEGMAEPVTKESMVAAYKEICSAYPMQIIRGTRVQGTSHIELDWHKDASGKPVFDSISLCPGPDPDGITTLKPPANPEA